MREDQRISINIMWNNTLNDLEDNVFIIYLFFLYAKVSCKFQEHIRNILSLATTINLYFGLTFLISN